MGREATDDEIWRAYRRRAQEVHPDHGGTDQAFDEVKKAYEVLGIPSRKEAYDRELAEPELTAQHSPPQNPFAAWDQSDAEGQTAETTEPSEPPRPDRRSWPEADEHERQETARQESERNRRLEEEVARWRARPAPERVHADRSVDVEIAFWLWIAVPVVDQIRTAFLLAAAGPTLGGVTMTSGFAADMVLVVPILAIEVILPFLMRRGHNWARICLTVLAGLAVYGTLRSFSGAPPFPMSADPFPMLALPPVIVRTVAVVMSFRPSVNAWFRSR